MSSNQAFEKALNTFVTSTKATMEAAASCANLSIEIFAENGDLSQAQKFLDAMDKVGRNFVRRNAFLKWMGDHSPLAMKEGKLVKDKSDSANAFRLEAAVAVNFWDYDPPEADITDFTSENLAKALQAVINRYSNENKFVAKNKAAELMLVKATKQVAALAA